MSTADSLGSRRTTGAELAAAEAARHSGVLITELSDLGRLRAVDGLFNAIWHPAPGNPPVTVELMRALSKAGNYVAGAFLGDVLVGASVGFLAAPAGSALHSHVTGVAGPAQRRSVGRALKLHQRAWALQRGVTRITWTYDPLVRRNAWFNLARLAARPVEYLPDFYGEMDDSINGADESDRLMTEWLLDSERVARAGAGEPVELDLAGLHAAGAISVVSVGDDGGPVLDRWPGPVAPERPWLVSVPPDIEALRLRNRGLAREWRRAVRSVLGGALDSGAAVRGFAREGCYVVDPVAPVGGAGTGRTEK